MCKNELNRILHKPSPNILTKGGDIKATKLLILTMVMSPNTVQEKTST